MSRKAYYLDADRWVDNMESNPIPFSSWALRSNRQYDPAFVNGMTERSRLPELQFNSRQSALWYLWDLRETYGWRPVQVRPPWYEIQATPWHNSLPLGGHRLVSVRSVASRWIACDADTTDPREARMRFPCEMSAETVITNIAYCTATIANRDYGFVEVTGFAVIK